VKKWILFLSWLCNDEVGIKTVCTDGKQMNECGAVDGMRIGRGN
jgi:hypothetical protein